MPTTELGRRCLEERLGINILEVCVLVSQNSSVLVLLPMAVPHGLTCAACPDTWILGCQAALHCWVTAWHWLSSC